MLKLNTKDKARDTHGLVVQLKPAYFESHVKREKFQKRDFELEVFNLAVKRKSCTSLLSIT